MSTSTGLSQGPSTSQHLCAAKKTLQDIFDTKIVIALDGDEIDALERDAFEALCLIRALKNKLAPINRIPPEVLALIPDSWDTQYKDKGAIPLTHVCRAWREMFISRASLWTHFGCLDMDKTRVYLERSKSSPITLWIGHWNDLSPHDPLLQVIPHATSRLKSLIVHTTPERLDHIITHLSQPAPDIEFLMISGGFGFEPASKPILKTSLFSGDLSSLHSLHLMYARTELPWRNMVHLTSFSLHHILLEGAAIGQLLDFLDSAPRLESVKLESATPTTGAQGGRLVSLDRLKLMSIRGDEPCSFLLDHLLIPVGAKLSMLTNTFSRGFAGHLPRSLNNLRNLPDFTDINLDFRGACPKVRFTGPNGRVTLTSASRQVDPTFLVFECLAQIDTSKTERLEIHRGNPPSRDPPYQALLRMKNLRILKLTRCRSPHHFIRALHPSTNPSEAAVCPKLEDLDLVLRTNSETFNIKDLINVAIARTLAGALLRAVRIIGGQSEPDPDRMLELRKYVSHVEYVPTRNGAIDDNSDGIVDDSDEDSDDSDGSDGSVEDSGEDGGEDGGDGDGGDSDGGCEEG